MREGQHLKASTLPQLAIEAGAENAVLRTQRTVNEFGLAGQGEAIAALVSVFDIQPKLSNAGATLVVMLLKNHRYDEAVETAKRVVIEEGPNLTYVNVLGVAALAKGDRDLADWAFDLVLTLDPTFLSARLNLADLTPRQGGASSARERIEAIVAAHPDNVSAMLLMARAQEAQGKAEEARRTAERAVTLDPKAVLISKNVQLRQRSITGPICWPSPLAKEQGLRCLKRFLARVPRSGDLVGWSSFLIRKAVAPVIYLAELLLRMNEAPQALSVR